MTLFVGEQKYKINEIEDTVNVVKDNSKYHAYLSVTILIIIIYHGTEIYERSHFTFVETISYALIYLLASNSFTKYSYRYSKQIIFTSILVICIATITGLIFPIDFLFINQLTRGVLIGLVTFELLYLLFIKILHKSGGEIIFENDSEYIFYEKKKYKIISDADSYKYKIELVENNNCKIEILNFFEVNHEHIDCENKIFFKAEYNNQLIGFLCAKFHNQYILEIEYLNCSETIEVNKVKKLLLQKIQIYSAVKSINFIQVKIEYNFVNSKNNDSELNLYKSSGFKIYDSKLSNQGENMIHSYMLHEVK